MKLAKLIYIDEEKCVNCHQCISKCPVWCANDGIDDNVIKVNEELCIGCGNCIRACTHEARLPVDDFDEAMEALQNKEKIIAIVAPAAAANFPDRYLNLNGWLKSLGVEAFFDVSLGAELTVKSYIEHIKKNNPQLVIAQPCPAIVTYIQVHLPELIQYLAPANSPMVHTMKMIRKFYPQYADYKILVVSPCVAKKREFDQTGYGDYNVVMTKINSYLTENNIDLKDFPSVDFSNDPAERAVLFSTPGGLLQTAERMIPGISKKTRKIEGPEVVYDYFKKLPQLIERGLNPLLIDCLNCELGCNGGTGTDNRDLSPDELEYYINKRKEEMQKKHHTEKDEKKSLKKLEQLISKYWQKGLYERKYLNLNENYTQNINDPNEEQIQEIYRLMHKYTDEDLKNCASCGYDKCEIMAKAIFNNLNKKENCHFYIHYKIDDLNKNLENKVKKRTEEITKQKNEIIEKNAVLEQQKEEIMTQAEELRATADALQEFNEKLRDQKNQIEKAYGNAQILSEFGQKITATLNMESINSMIYNYVSSLMDTSAFGIGILNKEREVLEFKHFMENKEVIPYFVNHISQKDSLAIWCLKNKKEILINDFEIEGHNFSYSHKHKKTSKLPKSIIFIPLTFENKAIGVITTQSYKKNAYSENDVINLRSLASYITIALDNANIYGVVNSQNRHINASINYAKTIQQAMLPPKEILTKAFDNFIIFRPKDVVSGDFYWFYQVGEFGKAGSISFIAVVDCTGHGVPGAFMSMVGSSILNKIVKEQKIYDTAEILNELNKEIKRSLRQDKSENNDGMDVCLCRVERINGKCKVMFSGAKRSLIYTDENNTIQILKGDRKSIGGSIFKKQKIFTSKELTLKKGGTLILSSDGYVDQNNYNRESFGTMKLLDILNAYINKPINELDEILNSVLDAHQGKEEQRDDITMIGVRL